MCANIMQSSKKLKKTISSLIWIIFLTSLTSFNPLTSNMILICWNHILSEIKCSFTISLVLYAQASWVGGGEITLNRAKVHHLSVVSWAMVDGVVGQAILLRPSPIRIDDFIILPENTITSCRKVRVVKERDLKSVGLRPRKFEPCCRRLYSLLMSFSSYLRIEVHKWYSSPFSESI